jgi:hypothetical protein
MKFYAEAVAAAVHAAVMTAAAVYTLRLMFIRSCPLLFVFPFFHGERPSQSLAAQREWKNAHSPAQAASGS